MKRIGILLNILMGLVLIIIGVSLSIKDVSASTDDFSSGDGTKNNPYVIKTIDELQKLNNYCGEKYKDTYFVIDKDVKEMDAKNKNFEPICKPIKNDEDVNKMLLLDDAFYGHFDGNNVEIKNLKIETESITGGLFGITNGAEISNIGIGENSSIKTDMKLSYKIISSTGGIVGKASNTKLKNVWNKGNISSIGAYVGGIVGRLLNNSTIDKSYNTGKISSGIDDVGHSYLGGIVGQGINSIIKNSYNNSNIEVDGTLIGGIVGVLDGKSEISNSYNSGSIKTDKDRNQTNGVGGIVGSTNNDNNTNKLKIDKVYNTGNINASHSKIGGIIGEVNNDLEINDVYNSGSIYAGNSAAVTSVAGGIVGYINDDNTIDIKNAANYTVDIKGEYPDLSNHSSGEYGKLQTVGLLIGETSNSSITIKNMYYLEEDEMPTSYIIKDNKNIKQEQVKGYKKEELKNKENYKGFDFDDTWKMDKEYAILNIDLDSNVNTDTNNNSNNNNTNNSELPKVTIKYNGKELDVDNFLYGDGRTFVDLKTFCDESEMCTSKLVNDTYEISKNKKLLDSMNDKYTYLVEHKPGTKIFTSSIIIGGRKIVDDENTQESTDVVSCPEDVKDYKCTDKEFYVPLRFLTQALGFRVEWNGETKEVNITDTFEKQFFEKYDVNITEGECNNLSSCNILEKNSKGEYEVEKNKEYNMIVSNKETKDIEKFSKYFSFYDTVDQEGDNEPYKYTLNSYQISSNKLNVLNDSSNNIINIAGVIIYKIKDEENASSGSYPFVVNNKFIIKN